MIEYITYKNEKIPIRVSYYALKKVKVETGKQLDDFDIEFLEPLLYYSMIAGCKAENRNMPFTREEIEFILDDIFTEFISILPKFFGVLSHGEKINDDPDSKKK